MMLIFFGLFVLLCLYKIQLKPKNGEKYMTDYMSVDKTTAIKGIFVIIVIFEHFNSYVTYTNPMDVFYFDYFSKIDQCMVTMFLFYSGFGVMESIKKKNISYVHKIPVTRVLGTLFRFDIAVLLFALVNIILGIYFSAKQFALSLIAWESIGNSNWYIFAVAVAYAITFIAFEICRDKGKYYPAAIFVTAGIAVYIYIMTHYVQAGSDWYATIILYACGIWYSLLKEPIEKIINRNFAVWTVIFVLTTACTAYFAKYRFVSFVHLELCMLFFTAFMVLFSMRIAVYNKILVWCGKHLFSLYILHRIPMIIFREIGVAELNIYLYFVLSVAVTVPIAWLFEKYAGKLWNLITSPRKKTT